MMEFPAATCPPTKMDQLALGVDCARHPIVTGCIVSNNGVPAGVQARNYLLSLRRATVKKHAGRPGDLSGAQYRDLLGKLETWERSGGKVNMPAPVLPIGHTAPPPTTSKLVPSDDTAASDKLAAAPTLTNTIN